MMAAMRGGAVALGDRSKLRELAADGRARSHAEWDLGATPCSASAAFPPAPTAPYRRTQEDDLSAKSTRTDTGGNSMDTIALVLTAVLGIISVWTSQKASRDAEASATQIERETVARDKDEATAGKLLVRVHAQMSEFIVPVQQSAIQYWWSVSFTAKQLGLHGYNELYGHRFYHPPATPYVNVLDNSVAHTKTINHIMIAAPFVQLTPVDEELLAADPEKRDRYIRIVLHSWLPPLRRIATILPVTMHLSELPSIADLEALMGDVSSWVGGSLTSLFAPTVDYASQFDAVADAWAAGDYSMLQPAGANFLWIIILTLQICKGRATKRELELLGQSSGSHSMGVQAFREVIVDGGSARQVVDT